jgi:peptidoglycan/LPS O-acetylase OafA/YrhL
MGKEEIYRGNILEITGVRAYMMVSEMLLHLWPPSRGWILAQWGQFAWIEMDLFFVMSGFLITGILLDSRHRVDYYRSFIARRALRILPPYYLLLVIVIGALLLSHGTYLKLVKEWGSPFWFLIYLGNFNFVYAGAWPRAMMAFGPLWSLQIEEQFYISFPLLVKKLDLKTLAKRMCIAVCLSPIIRIALYYIDPHNPFLQYVSLPCRMEGLALGALIAIRFRMGPWHIPKKLITWLAFGLLGITAILSIVSTRIESVEAWSTTFNRTFGYLLSSVACACFMLWMIVFRDRPVTAWLRHPVALYLGKISYGTYIYHIPVWIALGVIADALGWKLPPVGMLRFVLAYILTYVCAIVSWHLLEQPMINLKARFAAPIEPQKATNLFNRAESH